jgi:hypothetical protein
VPIYSYLDLSTAHLREEEMAAVKANLPDLDDSGPRIIDHEYGAWVNVPEDILGREDYHAALAEAYPNLHNVLVYAKTKGCNWVNFDQDAEIEQPTWPLPTFEW